MTDINYSKYARGIAAIACPILLVVAGSSTALGRIGQSSSSAQADDPQSETAISVLSGQITGEVQRLPADSSVETFEAAILFVVDQAAQPVNIVCAALDRSAAVAGTPNNAKAAMGNVCRTVRRRAGTGAIGSNNGNGFGAATFGIPSVSLGGGGSNYSTTNR